MSSEKTQRQRVRRALAPLHAFSVENLVNPGTPDLSFAGGWLELKCVPEWPRQGGVLREGVGREHFTAQQRLFCRTWARRQGFHSVCLQVADELFLIEPVAAADHLGVDWTELDIREGAWWYCRRYNDADLLKVIKRVTRRSVEPWEKRMKRL